MVGPRVKKLAYDLINYSCDLNEGEELLLESVRLELPLVKELIREIYAVGVTPLVTIKDNEVNRVLCMECTPEQLEMMARYEGARMADVDAYSGVRSGSNSSVAV